MEKFEYHAPFSSEVVGRIYDAAQHWLSAAEGIQDVADHGDWETLEAARDVRDVASAAYQKLADGMDWTAALADERDAIVAILKAIQQVENGLIDKLSGYQRDLVDSLNSVKMEGELQKKYDLA